MKDAREFISYWLLNSFIFYFAPLVFVGMIVVGNARLSPFMASVISGFLLTLADTLTMPAFVSLKIKLKDEWQMTLAFLFVNVISIWLIARYADLTGVGIVNAWAAVSLGVVFSLAQWVVWKYVLKKKKKKKEE